MSQIRPAMIAAITAFAAILLVPAAAARADNVVNDVSVGGSDTFTVGGSSTIAYKVVATGVGGGSDTQAGCNAADNTPATINIIAPANVTATPASLTFDACNDFKGVVFTASAPGDYAIEVSVSDLGGGIYNLNPAGLTLHVGSGSVVDTTPPIITPTVSGTLGSNGWYTGDVPVSWSVVDDGSSISSTTGCEPTTITADTSGVTLTCSATSAGGTESNSVTVKRDATPPTIDRMGGPANGSSHYFGSVPAAPTCTTNDDLSGPGGCTVTGYSTTVGAATITDTAHDVAGNQSTVQSSYTVLPWTLRGFYQPVDMNGVFNTVKGGATVPLKFEVFAGSNEMTDTAVVKSFRYGQIACSATAPVDELEITTTGGTALRYDSLSGQFLQNWQTTRTIAGNCYSVTLTTQDGSSISAFFKIR